MGDYDVSLRDFIERILSERETAYRAELASARAALHGTAEALKDKLAEMNQFREQLNLERRTYVTHDKLDDVLSPLEKRVGAMEGRSQNIDGRFWALGAVLTVGLTVLALVLRYLK